MDKEFGYSDGHHELVIKSHAGLYYLFFDGHKGYIAKADDIKVLRAYIDGYSRGWSIGYQDHAHRQYEVELQDTIGGGRFADDYGFPTNPPIVICAKNQKHARGQLKLPKGVKISKLKRV